MVTNKFFKNLVIITFLLLIPYCIIAYNHIGEDCFISFRYAENFAAGKGLVFNEGEMVEGYSNYLYTVILGVAKFIGLDVVLFAKIFCVLCYALMVFPASYFFIHPGQKKIHASRGLVPALMFFNPMLHYYTDRALETTPYALLLVSAMFFLKRRRYFNASICYIGVALTRPEGFVYFFAGLLLPFLDVRRLLTKELKNLNWGKTLSTRRFILPFFLCMGVFVFWRYMTYGHLFPNTVYAKVSKFNFIQNPSLSDLWAFTWSWTFMPLLAAISYIYILKVKKGTREKKGVLIIGVTAAMIIAYNLYIGKVAAEPFRHMLPIVPIFIIMIGEAFRQLADRINDYRKMWVIAVIIGLMNAISPTNGDAPESRLHVKTIQFLFKWDIVSRVKWFMEPPVFQYAETGRKLKEIIPADSLCAADQIGQLGYYSGLKIIDLLGLTDEHISHNGFSKEYLFKRNPDYCIIYCADMIPYIPHLAKLVKDPEFLSRYAPEYRIQWQIDKNEFVVYAKKEKIPQDKQTSAPEIITVGLSKAELGKKWRMSFPE